MINCPSCGGEIEGVSPLIRSIDCSFCGSWLRLNNQIWKANAGQEIALNAPSFLRVGLVGNLANGEHYKVMGRIRLQYEQDTWDEWWLEDSYGNGFWLEEDDGIYYKHINTQELELTTSSSNIHVAEDLSLSNGLTLFVTEKFEAKIIGREGFLPSEPETNSVVTYVDGVANESEYSLEIENQHASLSQAQIFDIQSVNWERK